MGDRTTVEMAFRTKDINQGLKNVIDEWSGEVADITAETDTENSITSYYFYDVNYGNLEEVEDYCTCHNIPYTKWYGNGAEYSEGNEYYVVIDKEDETLSMSYDYQEWKSSTSKSVIDDIESIKNNLDGSTIEQLEQLIEKYKMNIPQTDISSKALYAKFDAKKAA